MTEAKNASPTDTTAILLAGGQGARLGGADKGWVLWRQRPLIEQVLERLRPQVGKIIVSCNRNLARYQSLGWPCVTDNISSDNLATGTEAEFAGPLAGISAACALVETNWILLCPCDTPLIPADLVRRLLDAVTEKNHTIAIPSQLGQLHYSHALLTTRFASTAQLQLQLGGGSLRHWFAGERNGGVEFPADDSFRNMNEPVDLIE